MINLQVMWVKTKNRMCYTTFEMHDKSGDKSDSRQGIITCHLIPYIYPTLQRPKKREASLPYSLHCDIKNITFSEQNMLNSVFSHLEQSYVTACDKRVPCPSLTFGLKVLVISSKRAMHNCFENQSKKYSY